MGEPSPSVAHLREVMDERDRRYTELRQADSRAIDAALAAAKEASAAALTAQKEAVTKAEDAQRTYNAGHNDLARKMEGQYGHMLPRTEADAIFGRVNEQIGDLKKEVTILRDTVTGMGAKGVGLNQAWGYVIGLIGLIGVAVTIVAVFVG